jgi:enoyl-CoA hydratase/carnithine racemase
VVVRGTGRAYSAGSDLDMQDGSAAPKLLEFFERQERTRDRLEALEAEMLPLLRACLPARNTP